MNIQHALKQVIGGTDLSRSDMTSVMNAIMTGECTDAQIAGFLVALRLKGETVDEITAAAEVMRSLSSKVDVNADYLVDTCGTGGDGANTFNISTTCAFVVAAAGARVAKHGNRSVSSNSGSADLLEAAGVNLALTPEQVAECIEEIGIGFMFAPAHHSAMKHAIAARKEMGVRTIFNVLGPLTNPASAPNQVMGVFDRSLLEPISSVLKKLGSRQVMVVHSIDGLDEISISAPTHIAELKNEMLSTYQIQPEDFGLQTAPIETIAINGVEDSLNTMHEIFDNRSGPARDIVCLNAGAAIYVSGIAETLKQGIEKADDVIANGLAKQKLNDLIQKSDHYKNNKEL